MERFWALQDPEIVMRTDPMWPDGGEYHGPAEFKGFLDRFLETFSEVRFAQDRDPELVGDSAMLHGRWVGRGLASGIETESVPFFVVFTSRGGLIDRAHFYFAEQDAREFAQSTA